MARLFRREQLAASPRHPQPISAQPWVPPPAPDAPAEGTTAAPADRRAAEELAHEVERLRTLVHHLGAEVSTAREDLRRHAQQEVIKLATAMAAQVIGQELAECPDLVVQAVGAALAATPQTRAVTVRLNPEDIELVRGAGETLFAHHSGPWQLVPDPALERGGCVLETSLGLVDARVEARLLALQQALEEGL